jgi:hypothetical protein
MKRIERLQRLAIRQHQCLAELLQHLFTRSRAPECGGWHVEQVLYVS